MRLSNFVPMKDHPVRLNRTTKGACRNSTVARVVGAGPRHCCCRVTCQGTGEKGRPAAPLPPAAAFREALLPSPEGNGQGGTVASGRMGCHRASAYLAPAGFGGGRCPRTQQGIEGSRAASPCHPPALLLWGGGRAPKLSSAYYSSLASAWSAVGPSGVCGVLRTFEVEQNLMSSCHHFFHHADVGQDLLFAFVFPLQ